MASVHYVLALPLLAIGAFVSMEPLSDRLLEAESSYHLSVHAHGDELFITWKPRAITGRRTVILEANEGLEHQAWLISPELRSVTYVRGAEETQIRLGSKDDSRSESVRLLDGQRAATIDQMKREGAQWAFDIENLHILRAVMQARASRLNSIQNEANDLLRAVRARQVR